MLLKVKDTSVMLREGGTPGGSNLGSSSVMVAPRPTGPRSLTVTPIGSSQHLRCCETEVIHPDPECLKMVPGPTPRDLSGTINASLASLNHSGELRSVFKLPRRRSINLSITPITLAHTSCQAAKRQSFLLQQLTYASLGQAKMLNYKDADGGWGWVGYASGPQLQGCSMIL